MAYVYEKIKDFLIISWRRNESTKGMTVRWDADYLFTELNFYTLVLYYNIDVGLNDSDEKKKLCVRIVRGNNPVINAFGTDNQELRSNFR